MDLPWEPSGSIRVSWSVQHHQRVGVSSFGPHCPPHRSRFRVDVSARGTATRGKKIRDLGKPRCQGGKGLWEGVTCPQKVPSPVILTRGRAGNPWKAEEGRRVWDLFPSPALPTAG